MSEEIKKFEAKEVRTLCDENETYNSEFEIGLKKLIFETRDNIENGKFRFDNGDEKMC